MPLPSPDTRIRIATAEDSPIILHHRRRMFEDMKEGTATDLDRMVEATAPWLDRALADGKVVAGGGVLVSPWPAGPKDPLAQRALIINVYTEPEFRKRGLARQLMLLIIRWLKEQGFRSVVLHASPEGRHLYEKLGFVPTNEMRLRL